MLKHKKNIKKTFAAPPPPDEGCGCGGRTHLAKPRKIDHKSEAVRQRMIVENKRRKIKI